MQTLISFVISLFCFYLIGLGATSIFSPSKAEAFLLGFATTRTKHFLELAIRICVGIALVLQSQFMRHSIIFQIFGWVLIGSSVALAITPWKWHQKFAEKSVPQATKYIKLIGVSSIFLSLLIFYCLFP